MEPASGWWSKPKRVIGGPKQAMDGQNGWWVKKGDRQSKTGGEWSKWAVNG